MNKIQTIFDRDWDGNHGVVNKMIPELTSEILLLDKDFKATEKIDGTNIRVTLRSGHCVRVEKRRNPNKTQKHKGITEPWYVDASEYDPQDKHIFKAVDNYMFLDYPDGEHNAEVYGKNIQGNPLNVDCNNVYMFNTDDALVFEDCPTTFRELKEWLPKQKSKIGFGKIEGIVWHHKSGIKYKIKTKDFK